MVCEKFQMKNILMYDYLLMPMVTNNPINAKAHGVAKYYTTLPSSGQI